MLPFLADAGDLAQWANRLDAPGYLPKLIRRLILAINSSLLIVVENPSRLLIPGGILWPYQGGMLQ